MFNFQNRYRHKDGSYRWLEWTSRPDYKARLMYAVARDISDRKQLEEAQARYKDELEQAVRERTASLQQRNEELNRLRQEDLRRLAMAAEYRDDQTFEHTERVGRTAALLAGLLGFSEHEVHVIRQAAPLHDIGKLGISDAILLKRRCHAPCGVSSLRDPPSCRMMCTDAMRFEGTEGMKGGSRTSF